MSSLNRRSFLARTLGGSASLLASSMLPASLGCRSESKSTRASLSAIGHVVIFMQENRSFDHYFGTLAGVRGWGDRHPLSRIGGGNVFGQPDSSSLVYPFRLNATTTSGQCVPDVNHDWFTGMQAVNGGRMDQWIPAKGAKALGYHTRPDIPFHYALADAFTICDHSFCSVNTSTNPNRLFLWTGTVDAAGRYEGPVMANDESKPFTWTTYPERLEQAGISWRVYQELDNYDDNALAWFKQYQEAPMESSLHVNGMMRRARNAFVDDVRNDALPAVSWIIAPSDLSEHPSAAPNKGATLAKLYLDALASNPAVWEKTVFVYTMDENGGFYDHVVPPTPPPDTPDEYVGGYPIGLGVRVPTIVVSPFTTGGAVCSQVFDHTSILRLLESFTGVEEPNISAWRRKVCGNLADTLNLSTTPYAFPTTLPDPTPLAAAADTACATLPPAMPNGETMPPAQETGTKTALVTPYRVVGEAFVHLAEASVTVSFTNSGSRAYPVSVHGLAHVEDVPRHLVVEANRAATTTYDASADGFFDLEVHGPASFFRRFAGSVLADANAGDPDPTVGLGVSYRSPRVWVGARNEGANPVVLVVTDALAATTTPYTVAPGGKLAVDATLVDRAYDVSVAIEGLPTSRFVRAYAGRLE